MKYTYLFAASVVFLAACSTGPRKPDYECPLDDVAMAKCASVGQAYAASKAMTTGTEVPRLQSVFDKRVQPGVGNTASGANFDVVAASGFPAPSQQGMPVFQQPQVMRVWVAPYVDADGHLRSGEYAYFSTPGKWNYGELKKQGAASGIFEPARSTNLGFTMAPIKKAINQTASPSPAAAASAASVKLDQVGAPADSTGSITQPYQRLSK